MVSVRLLVQIFAVGSIAAVAACGGGGSSGTPAPVPTSTSVAVPTPTPTATATAVPSPGTLYVATTATAGPVTAYAAASTGASAPLETIAPAGVVPVSLAEDAAGNLYVLNRSGNSVLIYPKGATTPSRTITSTALVGPETSIAVDPSGNVYVLGFVTINATVGTQFGVAEFAPNAGTGATPIDAYTQTTQNNNVTGIGVDGVGQMYVPANVTGGNNEILVFAAGTTGGSATPTRTISATQLGASSGLNAIAVDAAGDVYVSVGTSNSIVEFAPQASGTATPARTITGAATLLANPTSIALDPAGELVVQNVPTVGAPYVTTYAAGANGNVAPVRTITGAANGAIAAGP